MTSSAPTAGTTAAISSADQNPDLVRDGGFQNGPSFKEGECGFDNALAEGDNMALTSWDYGPNGYNKGNQDDKIGKYIDATSNVYAFAQSDARDKVDGSNAIDLVGRGNDHHGYVGQHLSGLTPGERYDVTFWAGSPWYNEDPHFTTMYYGVIDGTSRSGGKVLDEVHVVTPPPPRQPINGGSWVRQWKRYQRSFVPPSSDVYLYFADETGNGYWTGTQLACVSVRLGAPAHVYQISRTAPDSSADNPLAAPADSPFAGFKVQIQDENNQPLSSKQVTLRLEPRRTGSNFVSQGQTSLTYPVTTDSQGWLAVPDGALQAGSQEGPMQLYVQLNGMQLGGQVNLKVGTAAARFSLSPGDGPLALQRGTGIRYPGVQLLAKDSGTVAAQTVSATLPQGRQLRFVAQQLTVQNVGVYNGDLSPDGRTLTFKNVNLNQPGQGLAPAMWVAVNAAEGAPTGYTNLDFRVGDQTSDSTTLDVQ